jgi:dihydroxyacid dehydratase/phosphogluconate dehydratase
MSRPRKRPEDFRSFRWFGPQDLRSFGHRSRLLQMGYERADFAGKPVIAIINTWSDINPCHAHFRTRAEEVRRGVLQAGGFPIELPAMSLSETFVKPSTMLYRNFLAMETEELIRSHPVDGVVLMGGCDKTTPALLMGAISADLPAIFMPAGPMLRGAYRGQTLGSGSDVWKYWDEKRAGRISEADWSEMEAGIARSYGVCMTMGTASTMTALADVLGMTLPNASSIPAADSGHARMAAATGRRAVEMVFEDTRPSAILTAASFDNAVAVLMALGGSTNAIIHLIAMARRAGVALDLKRFDAIARTTPVIANLRPTGQFLMEDFHYAGGLGALLAEMGDLLDLDQQTVNGQTLRENIAGAKVWTPDVIRPLDNPVAGRDGLAIL